MTDGRLVPNRANDRCDRCRFWEPHVRDYHVPSWGYADEYGCQRHAPTVSLIVRTRIESDDSRGHWPRTKPSDWCGDFEPVSTG